MNGYSWIGWGIGLLVAILASLALVNVGISSSNGYGWLHFIVGFIFGAAGYRIGTVYGEAKRGK